MKKTVSFLIIVILSCRVTAQTYQLPLKELTASFIDMHAHTNKSGNFFNPLLEASKWFFSTGNKPFISAVSALRKQLKIGVDSSVRLIFDTLMNNYVTNHLWDEYPGQPEKNVDLFSYCNKTICPCVSAKINKSPSKRLDENDMKDCVVNLATDTAYLNTIKRIAGSMTMNEIYAISQLSPLYSMQHCPELCNYFLSIIKENSAYLCIYELKRQFRDADHTIIALYNKKDFTGLAAIFPEYKKFEQQIKQVSKLFDQGRMSIYPVQKITALGSLDFINTYYTYKNSKPLVLGQVLYTIKEDAFDAPILSIKFLTADKIINKTAVFKELNDSEVEIPTPLQETIKDVRIDTIRQKN